MNKNIMIPLVALMMLAMVGAASAATVDEVEIRGTIVEVNATANTIYEAGSSAATGTASYTWNPYNFAAFWYDEDDDLKSERLVIKAITGQEIASTDLIYNTTPQKQAYAILGKVSGVNKLGTVDNKWIDSYYIEGWMAEKYVAIDSGANTSTGTANKLSKLLVEFTSSSDKKTMSTGESWDLSSGFTLTAGQIDLDGNKVWLSLDKDGKNIDDAVIDTSTTDKEDRVYTYTTDMAGVKDVVLFSCYIDAVFRGTDSNLVQLKYVFLIDNEILEVKTDQTYGDMEVTTANDQKIELQNKDNTISLTANTEVEIMKDMFFRVADNDTVTRFYPYRVYIEPGDYNVRGTIVEVNATANTIYEAGSSAATGTAIYTWNPYNFAAFWYDEDDDLKSERLVIKAITGQEIASTDLIYNTTPQKQAYAILGKVSGVNKLGTVDNKWIDSYYIEGWMAEKYVAIDSGANTSTGTANKLSKLLVEFTSSSDKKTMSTGESWDLSSGFTLTAGQIDLDGNKVWLSLDKDGKNIDDAVIDTSTTDKEDRVYTYTTDMAGVKDVVLFSCYIDAVFRGTDSNLVQLKYVFLIDNEILEVKTDQTYGDMEVTTANDQKIELQNKDNTISLTANTEVEIMEDMFFRVADNNTVTRFYPYKVLTITGVAPAEPEETATEEPTDVEPADAEPADAEPADAEPADAEPVEPVEEPTDAEPVEPVEEPTEKPKVPGFEAVFAISGLLAIAYLVLRQRD